MALTFSERREITRQLRESFEIAGGGIVYQNDGNNRVVTGDGSGGIQAETNLLFDGTELDVVGDATTNNLRIGDNTTPASRLSIAAAADVSTTIVDITNNSGTDAIKFDIDGSNIPGLVLNANGRIETTGNSNQLYLKSDGTVSLSNTDGSAKLDLGTETGSLNDVKPHLVAKSVSSNFPIEIASIIGTGGTIAEQYFSINATVDSANATYATPKFVGGTGGGYVFRVHGGNMDILRSPAGTNQAGSAVISLLSTGNVALGQSSGTSSTLNVSNNSTSQLYLESTGDISIADIGPAISFSGKYTSGDTLTNYGYIKTHKENTTASEYGSEMSFWTRTNGSAAAERMRIISSGNVGIGTETPVALSNQTSLTIDGTQVGRVDLKASGGGGGAMFGTSSALTMQANSGVAVNLDSAAGQPITFQVGSSEKARVHSDGNVGIGVVDPFTNLHIQSTDSEHLTIIKASDVTNAVSEITATIQGGSINTAGSPEIGGSISFGVFDDDGGGAGTNFGGSVIFNTRTVGASTPVEKMRLTADGRLGVNTDDPVSKIHLEDGAFTNRYTSVSTNATAAVTQGIRMQNLSDTDNNFAVGTDFYNSTGFVTGRFGAIFRDAGDRNTDLYWATRANSAALVSHMFLTSAGRLGIGCCDPQSNLHIQGTQAAIRLQESGQTYYNIIRANGDGLYLGADDGNTGGTGADIRFNVEGSEKFRICTDGNMVSTGGCFVATCFAGKATSADSATSAGSATNATFATSATNATNASSANNVNTQCSSCVASTVVCRDASGNFAAGTITANITGSAASATNATFANAATNATNATFATSAGSATNATFANAATNATNASSANNVNTQCSSCVASTVVCRDASGNFAAGTITANITGSAASATNATFANAATNATSATSATNATFATSAGSATNATFATSATNATNASSANNVNTQCSANCVSTVVCRNTSGNFSAGTITANITGSAGSATNATFANTATNATFANAATNATSATNAGAANNVNTQCSSCCTNTVVCRDASGNFAAGTITANITGSAGSATNATFANAATNATFANTATNASAATNASFATTATNATFANSATNATNASSANNVNTQCSCNVASTVVCRDGSGNFKASDPTASDHVATKNYVDTEIAAAGPASDTIGVRVIGAGGGGGSADGVCGGGTCFGGGGGGGGGGLYCDDSFIVEDCETFSVIIGSGGVGATVANASGAVGGQTSFAGIIAYGGGGGGGKTNTYINPAIDPCLNGASGGGAPVRASNTQNLGGNACTAPSPGCATKVWCYGQTGSIGGKDTGSPNPCIAGGAGAGLTTGSCSPAVYNDYRASCFRTTGLAWSDGSYPGNGGHGAITGWDSNTLLFVGAGGAGSSCDRLICDPSLPTGIMGQYKCTTSATYCSNICQIFCNVGCMNGNCWGDGGSGGNNQQAPVESGAHNPNAGNGKHGAVVFCYPYPNTCLNTASYPGTVLQSYVAGNTSCVACVTSGSGQICFSVVA